jgi:hypothetical protein
MSNFSKPLTIIEHATTALGATTGLMRRRALKI